MRKKRIKSKHVLTAIETWSVFDSGGNENETNDMRSRDNDDLRDCLGAEYRGKARAGYQ
jgi:hypothetical protein